MTRDPYDQEGFERWVRREESELNLERAERRPARMYRATLTEHAWRGWKNRPHRETRVQFAPYWPTPTDAERQACALGTRRAADPEVMRERARRVCGSSPAFGAPFGVDDKTVEACKSRFNNFEPVGEGPVIPAEGVAFTTEHPPCEALARPDAFRDAVRKLVSRLPKDEFNTSGYFARDELLAVRALLGEPT